MPNAYQQRNETLAAIGFDSYAEYLKSPLWYSIRRSAFSHKGRKCVRCRKPASQIHHASYAEPVLLGHDLSKLHPVCRRCHELAEYLPNGSKSSLDHANQVLINHASPAKYYPKKLKKKRGSSISRYYGPPPPCKRKKDKIIYPCWCHVYAKASKCHRCFPGILALPPES